MRIDLVSIFPDYFAPLGLSLLGKAGEAGLVEAHVHDLRQWTHDRHRSVDDTPYGGGAGMVMMPTVWGEAIDELLEGAPYALEGARSGPSRTVLAIPTPSGTPLTQAMAADLAAAGHLIIACGRYEGIDQRVADHYRERGLEVLEYSIGDYVLNGGEAAALVLVEAVTRLLDGFMGNPESIVEESHSDGLLEYPAYTKPRTWRELEVPAVLLGGDHAAIARWRRDRALERTAKRRPDMVGGLALDALDFADRTTLARAGVLLTDEGPHHLEIRPARADEAGIIAELAARTFPDACPPGLPAEAIEAFIADELSEEAFAEHLANPEDRILLAFVDGRAGGYSLVRTGGDAIGADMLRPGKIEAGDAYLSKCYADTPWRGTGLAGALLESAVEDAAGHSRAARIVLGTNSVNTRAQRFYRKHGFVKKGRRTFTVGGVRNHDVVLVRDLTKLRAPFAT